MLIAQQISGEFPIVSVPSFSDKMKNCHEGSFQICILGLDLNLCITWPLKTSVIEYLQVRILK